MNIKSKLSLLFVLLFSTGMYAQKPINTYDIKNTKALKEFFKYTEDRVPLICAHRGGIIKGYPENSIATLEQMMTKISTFFEIDPRLTKDSVIVVMHDATLDRTTTGKGKLADYTWEEVKKLKLKDDKGNPTEYGINTLDEVLQWAKGKTILMLDKKDVPFDMLYKAIAKNKAQAHVVLSAYKAAEAKYYYDKDKSLMFEVFIKTEEQFADFDKAGVPWENIFAYVGVPRAKSLYDKIHAKGAMVMVYTATSIDKLKDAEERKKAYHNVFTNGADMIMADRAMEVWDVAQTYMPKKSNKDKFFKNIKK
jgi:glycerophosphoryl diester phosphodiesterase